MWGFVDVGEPMHAATCQTWEAPRCTIRQIRDLLEVARYFRANGHSSSNVDCEVSPQRSSEKTLYQTRPSTQSQTRTKALHLDFDEHH